MLVLAPVAGQAYGVLMFALIFGQHNGVFILGVAIEDQCALFIQGEQSPALCALLGPGGESRAARWTDRHTASQISSITRCTPTTEERLMLPGMTETTSEKRKFFIGNLSSVRLMIARTGGEGYWWDWSHILRRGLSRLTGLLPDPIL